MDRSLAHVELISNLSPIPEYDRVELATILGWQVVVRKDEFNIGDKCVYFEIDSLLPEEDWSEFLRPKHFKVKTQKMCKTISQGLALPLSTFPTVSPNAAVGTDLTKTLKVKYHVPEDNVRKASSPNPNAKYNSMAQRYPGLFKTKPFRFLMKRLWGRKLLFIFFGRKKDKPKGFPTKFEFVNKTDETRCENIPTILENKQPWIQTLKVDGTSSTYILERIPPKFPFQKPKYEYYVCSRNVRQLDPKQVCFHDENVYWAMSDKYHIREFLQDQLEKHPEYTYICLQGETAGVGVQGNPHKLPDTQFFGFNYITSTNGRWNSVDAANLCSQYNIPWVPIISIVYTLPDTMEDLKLQADGPCELPGSSGLREGYVYRSHDGRTSFKNVSRKYLLKHDL